MRAKIIPHEIFYSEALFSGDSAPRLLADLSALGGEAIPVAPHVLDTLSDRDTSQGILATFALVELVTSLDELEPISQSPISNLQSPISTRSVQSPREASNLQSPPLLLILDQLQDPGNLGTLLRTADAAGVRAVILLEPCVDPFDPKTVRGTMGSLFNVPFARTAEPAALLPQLAKMGYHVIGADGSRGRPPWQSEALVGPVALVLGNEARGLSPELQPHLADYVSLPLLGRAESLNVAIAGGVLMYEWLRLNAPT
jgi:tRNA G18 (ribose-2'-O)-methylase SpoU